MFDNKVAIVKTDKFSYPDQDIFCRLSDPSDFSGVEDNHIYNMVTDCLRLLDLDSEHYGTTEWNPLGRFISPGDRVLLKPNMVLDSNRIKENGTDCLITNPSIVAAILDYAVRAGDKESTYVIGDAPLSDCDFDKLVEENGYNRIVSLYRERGYDVRLVDFRNVKVWKDELGIRRDQNDDRQFDNGIVVKLNELSAFNGLSENHLSRLRVTDYDPRIIIRHHTTELHEYMISRELLQADAVINLPKPKTHRKAGITASLKNMVGINSNKEFLPHHTLGSKEEGGDDYEKKNSDLSEAEKLLDERNILNQEGRLEEAADKSKAFSQKFREGQSSEYYFEGSWFGNDTIWRTIDDLNRILYYADKSGKICSTVQRKVLSIGDMVISGSGEGPLAPEPVNCGVLIGGEDPLLFDRTVCSIMGFDYHKVPVLNENSAKTLRTGACPLQGEDTPEIVSNDSRYNLKDLEQIRNIGDCVFVPAFGWQAALGHSYIDEISGNLMSMDQFFESVAHNDGRKIAIYGAGMRGIELYNNLKSKGIAIDQFVDGDNNKHKKDYYDGISCTSLKDCVDSSYFLITIRSLSTRVEVAHQIVNAYPHSNIVFS